MSGEAKVDNTILEPAITLFTDHWTPGVTIARAFSALNCSGAYHVRLNISVEVVNITTSVPLYCRYHDLPQDGVVSSICVRTMYTQYTSQCNNAVVDLKQDERCDQYCWRRTPDNVRNCQNLPIIIQPQKLPILTLHFMTYHLLVVLFNYTL